MLKFYFIVTTATRPVVLPNWTPWPVADSTFTPRPSRYALTASARRCESLRLYSVEPSLEAHASTT